MSRAPAPVRIHRGHRGPDWLKNANLALAFLIELAALVTFAFVGVLLPDGIIRLVAGAAAVAVFVALWGRYAAPRARRRLKGQPLLLFKIAVFTLAVIVLWAISQPVWAAMLGILAAGNLALARYLGQH